MDIVDLPPRTTSDLITTIGRSVLGAHAVLEGPFGPRRLVYADHTASGRALDFVEDFISERVLPLYANTHTESSATGLAMTRLRQEARESLRQLAGAGPDTAVIFCGSGATAAIHKLIGILELGRTAGPDRRQGPDDPVGDERPLVLIGPYEHHSNEVSWRETVADVLTVPADRAGRIDLAALTELLVRHADRPLRIGSFSAASNVTGILSDTAAIATVLHRHGALAFFDFAAAGPYTRIDMDGTPAPGGIVIDPDSRKDAVFLSPHKFVGGPGTPGVLLVRRGLVRNQVPVVPGGGTVAFVTPTRHRYLDDVEQREEGGTPAIIESIRAGLAARVKQAVGVQAIQTREEHLVGLALRRWRRNPAIRILGDTGADRLAILSFTVAAPTGRLLHHNFVVALLNDLFGIQARGGCSCAGPYGHRLLGIDEALSDAFTEAVIAGCAGIKPGWVRVTLPYFLDDETVDYVLAAVELVATAGWRLLTHYAFEPTTGQWRHRSWSAPSLVSLDDLVISPDGRIRTVTRPIAGPAPELAAALATGRRILTCTEPLPAPTEPVAAPGSDTAAALRWFEPGAPARA